MDLTDAIVNARANYHGEVEAISRKFGRYVSLITFLEVSESTYLRTRQWTRNQLFLMKSRRAANPWNAFVRDKLKEENAGRHTPNHSNVPLTTVSLDRARGDRYRLHEFVNQYKAELRKEYFQLTEEQKVVLTKKIQLLRAEKKSIVRANPAAVQKDIEHTFRDVMEPEVSKTIISHHWM